MQQPRPYKGKSLLAYPDDYTVVDIETNGHGDTFDIIEVSAIKVRGGEVVDTFSSFVRPRYPIEWFITDLTGITDSMVWDAPAPKTVLAAFADFAGEDILIGHNVNFDVGALYDGMVKYLDRPLTNDFVDVLRISRKLLPDLPSHKQVDVAAHFGIDTQGAHRALKDCEICNGNYRRLKEMAKEAVALTVPFTVYGEGQNVPAVYLIADRGEGEGVWRILEDKGLPCRLISLSVEDWGRDLSPWAAPAVFGNQPFGGGADAYLARIEGYIREVEKDFTPTCRILAGYSLAGLCALYAAYRLPLFDRIVSASGSVWYEGWDEFVRQTPFARVPQAVYLSVGDREKFSRNPRLQTVESATVALRDHYAGLGITTRFDLNPGNHFVDAPERLAKGIEWILSVK